MNIYEKKHDKIIKWANEGKRVSPLQAIRSFCTECLGYNAEEVRACASKNSCPLWHFRFGRNRSGKRGGGMSKRSLEALELARKRPKKAKK